jgi:hypothetical protein
LNVDDDFRLSERLRQTIIGGILCPQRITA